MATIDLSNLTLDDKVKLTQIINATRTLTSTQKQILKLKIRRIK